MRAGALPVLLIGMLQPTGCRDVAVEPDRAATAPEFRGEVDLEVGEATGNEAYLFTVISGITQDEAERIYVADLQTHEVRVFGPGGRFLFRFGGEGSGPGEFRHPCCLAWGPDGRLWVREAGNARYSLFRTLADGVAFETTVRSQHGSGASFEPVTFDRGKRLVDVGTRLDRDGRGSEVRVHVTLPGDVDSTVTIPGPPARQLGVHEVRRDRAVLFLWQPYGPRHLVAHGPEARWAEALSSAYEVELHNAAGELVNIVGPPGPGPPISAEERAEAEEWIRADAERAALRRGEIPFEVPDRKPPLSYLIFDEVGRLWVGRSRGVGDEHIADVYDDTGNLVGRVRWPGDVRVTGGGWVGTMSLLGIRRDSLGVQHLVRVRFAEGR